MPITPAAAADSGRRPPFAPPAPPISRQAALTTICNRQLPRSTEREDAVVAVASNAPPPDAALRGQLLLRLARYQPRALDPNYFTISLDDLSRQAVHGHALARSTLMDEAFASPPDVGKSNRAAYAPWAALAADTPVANVLRTIFTLNPTVTGVVIGERHADAAPKRLVIDHLQESVGEGMGSRIDTLFLEHIPGDALQEDLDACNLGEPPSTALLDYLQWLDDGHGTTRKSGYADLVRECAAFNAANMTGQRLRLVALDTSASYFLKGVEERVGCAEPRTRVFNHQAQKTITIDRRANPSTGKWLALVGNSHIGRWNGDPGLGPRLGVPTVRVEECRTEEAGCGFDPGAPARKGFAGPMQGLVQGDYLLNVASNVPQAKIASAHPCSWHVSRLQQPGDFLVEGDFLFYRHSDWTLVQRRMERCSDGSIRIAPLPLEHMPTTFRDVEVLRSVLDTRIRDGRLDAPGTCYLGKDEAGDILTHRSRSGRLVRTRIVSEAIGYRLVITADHSVNFKVFKDNVFPDLDRLGIALTGVLRPPLSTADLTLDSTRL